MQKTRLILIVGVIVLVAGGIKLALAEDTFPPLPDIGSSTATAAQTSTETITYEVVGGATATVATYSQSAEDEADTGPEIYILIGLSLVAGLGFYWIKKYFDHKRYMI